MTTAVDAEVVDLAVTPLRELNQRLHDIALRGEGPRRWRIVNPKGAHAVAGGLDAEIEVEIDGLGRLTNPVVKCDVDLAGPGEQLAVSANTLHVALAIPEDEAERRVAEGRLEP